MTIKTVAHVRKRCSHTSSNGLVSLKQLSQTSLTTRSAVGMSGHAGLAATEIAARRRTQACNIALLPQVHGHQRTSTHLVLPREGNKSPSQLTGVPAITTQVVRPDLERLSERLGIRKESMLTSLHA
jgi:hypothetical protein